ncbi:hypothetical protein M0Q28_00400 [Patescibacteria group bacterium]|jgi:hypothetical protein|nr:hypothetical protein [Patescibacteria group bacterium]
MRYFHTCFVLLLFFVCGCAGFGPPPDSSESRPHYDITVEVGDRGFLYAVTQEGVYYTDEEEFASVLMSYQSALDAEGVELRLVPGPELATHFEEGSVSEALTDGVGVAREELDGPVPFTPYYFSTGCNYGYVSGCVSRSASYCAVRLRDTRYGGSAGLRFDLHAAAYRDAGRACLGLYESARGWINSCSCSPSARDFGEATRRITDSLYQAFLAVGLTVAAAASMARMIAPVVAAGALAL